MADEEWKPTNASGSTTEEEESENNQEVLGIVLLGSIMLVTAVALFLLLPRPLFTYAADEVYYTHSNLTVMDDLIKPKTRRTEEEWARLRKKYSVDFSPILTPIDQEQSEAMMVVANECLPPHKIKTQVVVKKAHKVFGLATDYLVCAMETEKTRLCLPDERQRLVQQLMAYRTLRQHLIGYEQAYSAIFNNPMAKDVRAITKILGQVDPKFKEPRKPNLNIGKDLHGRIGEHLKTLNHEGFIAAADFGWDGLLIPSEFSSYLADGVEGDSQCG